MLDDKDKSKEKFKLIPAVHLILRRKDEILLLQRANTGYQVGKYSLITGHVDGNELATNEIAREAKKEAGITIDPTNLKFVHVAHRLNRNQVGQERIDLFYELWEWEGEVVNAEPNKCDDLSWYSINELPDNTIPFIRLVLSDVLNNVYYSEYTEEPV